MKNTKQLMALTLALTTLLSTANAATVKPTTLCQKTALKSALAELKAEFPNSGDANTTIDSIRQTQTHVMITLENEFANDIPLDILVTIKMLPDSAHCQVVGKPKITSPDNS